MATACGCLFKVNRFCSFDGDLVVRILDTPLHIDGSLIDR